MISILEREAPAGVTPDWLRLGSAQQTLLKVLAILLMLVDHANRLLWGSQPWLFTLGRVAFPLFAFLIAYNLAIRGVPARRYALPLLLFGVISQGPAMLALSRDPFPLNIFFTLLLGVTFLPLRRLYASTLPAGWVAQGMSWTLTALVFFSLSLPLEYGPAGVFLIPPMMVFLERPSVPAVYQRVSVDVSGCVAAAAAGRLGAYP